MTYEKLMKEIEALNLKDITLLEEKTEKPNVYGYYKGKDKWIVYKTTNIGYEHVLGECDKKGEAVDLLYKKMKNRAKHLKWCEKHHAKTEK